MPYHKKYKPLDAERMLARCHEEGECLIWGGYSPNKTPKVYDVSSRKIVSARGMLWALSHGKPLRTDGYWGHGCGNWRCINPEHAIHRSEAQHAKHMSQRIHSGDMPAAEMLRVAKMARTKRRVTDEQILDIRTSSEPSRVVAMRHGISKSMVAKYRRGISGATAASNPFAQLVAAAA